MNRTVTNDSPTNVYASTSWVGTNTFAFNTGSLTYTNLTLKIETPGPTFVDAVLPCILILWGMALGFFIGRYRARQRRMQEENEDLRGI